MENKTQDTTWADLFSEGRTIYYEGYDPEGFCAQIKAEFGFDPRERPRLDLFTGQPEHSWCDCPYCARGFHCPAEHLDAIYGSGRWPMGS